jgi:hypothetical protein
MKGFCSKTFRQRVYLWMLYYHYLLYVDHIDDLFLFEGMKIAIKHRNHPMNDLTRMVEVRQIPARLLNM